MKKTLSSVGNILKSESSSKGDKSFYGKVLSTITKDNKVVGYNVQVGDSTIEARKLAGAEVDNTVLCTTLANGTTVVTGTLNGDADAIEALTEAGNASTQAGNAYDKALQAETDAALAKDKAIEALDDAYTAQLRADSAYNKAEGVENHFWYDSSGAHVSESTTIGSTTANTLINAGGMAIRKGTTELAKFTDNLIELGKNSASALIQFCGGKAELGIYNNVLQFKRLPSGESGRGLIISSAETDGYLGASCGPYVGDGTSASCDITASMFRGCGASVEAYTNRNSESKVTISAREIYLQDDPYYGSENTTVYINGSPLNAGGCPVGTVAMWLTDTAPSGWLFSRGQFVNISDYPNLFNVIGYTYGSGSGTFRLPDFEDRFPFGAGWHYTTGATGGESTVTLTTNEMPSHDHTLPQVQGAHKHFGYYKKIKQGTGTSVSVVSSYGGKDGETEYRVTQIDGEHDHILNTSGGGAAHNNMPPYLAIRFIIKY